MSQSYHVYILSCGDGSYYVGSTRSLMDRLAAHAKGRATPFTANRRPIRLVYSEEHRSLEEACARERQIKKWTRAKKEVLISGDLQTLRELSTKRH